jgi:hypothetical protein
MQRIILFARSVIPQDPSQLFLLAGSVLLLICVELRCYPETSEFLHPNIYNLPDVYRSWLYVSSAARLLIFLAGAAGLFVSFWPGVRAARRVLFFSFCFRHSRASPRFVTVISIYRNCRIFRVKA